MDLETQIAQSRDLIKGLRIQADAGAIMVRIDLLWSLHERLRRTMHMMIESTTDREMFDVLTIDVAAEMSSILEEIQPLIDSHKAKIEEGNVILERIEEPAWPEILTDLHVHADGKP